MTQPAPSMELVPMGRTGVKVSRLGLGCWTFGWTADEAVSRRIIDRAIDAGINFFDTANNYSRGESERILGRALEGRRDRLLVATKAYNPALPADGPNDRGLSRRNLLRGVEQSLRNLKTDWIDLFQAHHVDPGTPIEETMRTFDDLVRSGKVRYAGCSNYVGWELTKALWASDRLGLIRYETIQPRYSLLQREIELELLPLCRDQGVGILPYSPLAAGYLAGKYGRGGVPAKGRLAGDTWHDTYRRYDQGAGPAVIDACRGIGEAHGKSVPQVALAWVLDHPEVTSLLVGASSPAQFEENLGCAGWRLTAGERKSLNDASNAPMPRDQYVAW